MFTIILFLPRKKIPHSIGDYIFMIIQFLAARRNSGALVLGVDQLSLEFFYSPHQPIVGRLFLHHSTFPKKFFIYGKQSATGELLTTDR